MTASIATAAAASFTQLARSEGGRRFLINFLDGIADGHISGPLALKLVESLNSLPPDMADWPACLSVLAETIYAAPDDFQFKGPETGVDTACWMTVKSAGDILSFLAAMPDLSKEEVAERLGIPDIEGAAFGLDDEQYRRIAEVLSDRSEGLGFMLARCFPNPADPDSLRPVPTWFSCWCRFPGRDSFGRDPAPRQAGRLRDWLGLGHYGENVPLFLIRARTEFASTRLNAHRPTILDGFDNPFYKHRAGDAYNRERIGSTLDIERLRGAAPGAEIAGGPEVVSRGVRFDPQIFLCQYLGMTPPLTWDTHVESLHEILLRADTSVERVVEMLAERVRSVEESV